MNSFLNSKSFKVIYFFFEIGKFYFSKNKLGVFFSISLPLLKLFQLSAGYVGKCAL